ncbi:DUF4097 family beta strand repeat-containing protein [Paenibacillus vandeheii]
MHSVYKKLLVAALGSVGLLAACTNNPLNSSSEGGNAQGAESQWMKLISNNAIDKELDQVSEKSASSLLVVDHPVGNIEVRSSEDGELQVRTYIQALNNRTGESILEELAQNAEVSLTTKGNTTTVEIHPKDETGTDLWSWADKNIGNSHFIVNYVIEAPANIVEYEISTEVGNISLAGLTGSYELANNTGSIDLNNIQVQGKSSIKSDAGTIRLDLNQLHDGSQLKASTELGTITALLPSNLAYTLKAETDLGKVSGASRGKSDINGGGPLLSLSTSVGTIKVENK